MCYCEEGQTILLPPSKPKLNHCSCIYSEHFSLLNISHLNDISQISVILITLTQINKVMTVEWPSVVMDNINVKYLKVKNVQTLCSYSGLIGFTQFFYSFWLNNFLTTMILRFVKSKATSKGCSFMSCRGTKF